MFVEHKEVGEDQKLDEAANLLLKAADLIDKGGLCQNGLFADYRGAYCVLGAIDKVAGFEPGDSMFCGLDEVLSSAISEACGRMIDAVGSIPAWNDEKGRTKDEVVAKLRAVALAG